MRAALSALALGCAAAVAAPPAPLLPGTAAGFAAAEAPRRVRVPAR